jgi:hypothetical protein
MGFLEDLGAPKGIDNGFNFGGVGVLVSIILIAFLILILVGAGVFYYYSKKAKKVSFCNEIIIFSNYSGKLQRIGKDYAKEIFIPDSNISLFYLKGKKIYIARPTRAMGRNEYWYSISKNGEWVNFDMESSADSDTLALANYDHRDTRYAYVNLVDIIKKNYQDKSVKWWKDPVIIGILGIVIITIIFGAVMWFILSRVGVLIDKLSPAIDATKSLVEQAKNINSGVVKA